MQFKVTQFFVLNMFTTAEPRAPLPPYTNTRGTAIVLHSSVFDIIIGVPILSHAQLKYSILFWK